jgi:iron complex outermembrane receptor protein
MTNCRHYLRKLKVARLLRLAGVAIVIGAQPAYSQQDMRQGAAIEEITVTARKRSESLQEVPISITAFTSEDLKIRGIRDLKDLANYTSNFTFESGPSARRNIPTIRGLGSPDLANENNNVGVFIDGVYVSARESINMSMLDIERVEVAKGPQSALYGRSTFAGAINYISRKPGEEFYSEVEATAAQDDQYRLTGIVSGPLTNNLAGRIALGYETDDGTYDNGSLSGGLGGVENYHALGTLRFTPTDTLDITLDAAWSDLTTDSAALGRYPNNCGTNPAPSQDTLYYSCGSIPGARSSGALGLSGDAYSMEGDQQRISLNVSMDFELFTLTSITAWNKTSQDSLADLDRTQGGEQRWGHTFNDRWFPIPGAPVEGCIGCLSDPDQINAFLDEDGEWVEIPTYFNENSSGDTKYLSQEIRFTSPDDQKVRWITGVFVFGQDSENKTGLAMDITDVRSFLPDNYRDGEFIFFDPYTDRWLRSDFSPMNVFVEGAEQNIVQESDKDSFQAAAFGAIDYDFTDTWTLTTELRYTYERRELTDNFDAFFGDGMPLNEEFTSRVTFLDPRIGLRWQATDSAMTYLSAARGSRSGDCNPGDLPEELDGFKCYDPEYNWTYELGAKTTWADSRVLVNAAVFYVDWEDLQFRTQVPELGNLSTITTNLGSLTSYGAELETQWLATDGLTLSMAYGFADPKFDDDKPLPDFGTSPLCSSGVFDPSQCIGNPVNPDDTRRYVDIAGNQLRRTSRHTFNAGLQYFDVLVEDIEWYTRWDYRYQSKQYQEMQNAIWIPSSSVVDARVGLREEAWDVSFWVRNLTDEETPLSAYAFTSDLNDSDYVTTVVNRERRRFGVTANYRF